MRPLAFLSLKTTGPDPEEDAITEIAVIRVDPRSLDVEEALSIGVVPEFVGRAVPEDEPETLLGDALERIEPLLAGAVLAGHELGEQLPFMRRAWAEHGHLPEGLYVYHVDTATLAWGLLASGEVEDLTLESVCGALGIDAELQTATGRAYASLEVARRLLPGQRDEARLRELRGDERDIMRTLLDRLHGGREEYGPWKADDGRVFAREALLEVLDCLHYVAAELVRIDRKGRVDGVRTRRVYVCHPFRDDPVRNAERVRDICVELVDEGFLPLAPHLFLPQILDETIDREVAMRLCLELLDDCDEVRVYGPDITDGMREEIARAEARGLKVAYDFPLGAEPDEAATVEAR